MLKYLYVLASDNDDYYLENALLSMFSLKMRMPKAYISLLCDKNTEKTFTGVRKNILDFVDEVTVPQIEDSFNKKQRSRWLKTSMRNHVAGDFLYIDCDTVIADDMEELTGLDIDIGAVLNVHCGINKYEPSRLRWIQQRDKKLGFESSIKTNKHFNGGVVFCRDTAVCHNFFDKWHSLWLYSNSMGCTEDQPSFNQTDFLFNGIITELDGIWNCHICNPGMIPYLYGSKIIHYFAEGNSQREFYRLAEPAVFEKIKETGCVSEETKELLKTPRQAFTKDSIFCSKPRDSDFLLSASFIFFNGLYRRKIIKWLDAPLQVLLDIYTYIKRIIGYKRMK
jgi:hypothetical protein